MMILGGHKAKAYCAVLWAQEYVDSAKRCLDRSGPDRELPCIRAYLDSVEEGLDMAKRELEAGVSSQCIKMIVEKMMREERL